MKTPPKKEGKIFADLHCHLARPKTRKQAQTLIEKLSSGLTGITAVEGNPKIATYEQLVQHFQLKEVEKGLLAKVVFNENHGYVLKTQEAAEGEIAPHILALAPRNYIPHPFLESEKIIEEIKKQEALAILAHPFTIPTEEFIRYRIRTGEEIKEILDLYDLVDEVEVFNAQNIRALPLISDLTSFLDMTYSNQLAQKSIELHNDHKKNKFKGIASSDTHFKPEQIQKSGIYLPQESEAYLLDSLLFNIKIGNFERQEQYVSRTSFLAGMFPLIGRIYEAIQNL